ncbi:MAG TPA: Clp protease, partial [Spirochaeta sp.]|nr:Clp protease [Spirochaeta sp.]
DEIEKAHPDVFNLLLQVLEEGELADNLGHKVSFRNAVLIMTSNAGAREINRGSSLGFSVHEGIMDHGEIKTSAMTELKRVFRPEFLNRIDDIVVFHSLDKKEVSAIFDIMMSEVALRLFENNIFIETSKRAKEKMIEDGYDVKYGARPLRRTIQNEIEDSLSLEILKGNFKSGDHILVECRNDKIKFKLKKVLSIDEANVK